jgi:hypothetical protein
MLEVKYVNMEFLQWEMQSQAVAREQNALTSLLNNLYHRSYRGKIQKKASRFTDQSPCLHWINSRGKVVQQIGKYLVHFFLVLGEVDWKTLEADIRFSMYCPKTWFSERNFKFSSFTLSTRCDKSATTNENVTTGAVLVTFLHELHKLLITNPYSYNEIERLMQ